MDIGSPINFNRPIIIVTTSLNVGVTFRGKVNCFPICYFVWFYFGLRYCIVCLDFLYDLT